MKILSIRKGFQGDHSSTSYEFYAIDKPLNKSEQAAVGSLSSRAMPTKRRVSFIYHGDWSDLPGGWEPLVEKYYDVMYSESYGWWTLAIAFNTEAQNVAEITKYEFDGTDDLGVSVESKANRVLVKIACRLDYSINIDDEYSGHDYYDYYEENEEDKDYEDAGESGDNLLDLLVQNREYLQKGNYRLLYGIRQKYGLPPEDDEGCEKANPPEPPEMDKLPGPIESLLSFME